MPSKEGYDSIATVGETGVWLRADFQSGSRVLNIAKGTTDPGVDCFGQ